MQKLELPVQRLVQEQPIVLRVMNGPALGVNATGAMVDDFTCRVLKEEVNKCYVGDAVFIVPLMLP